MSPDIVIDGQLVARVPDKTGVYKAMDGTSLYVNSDEIDADRTRQILMLDGLSIGGKRYVGLTFEGVGGTTRTKKGGDGRKPDLEVTLQDRPIKVGYSPRIPGTERIVISASGQSNIGYERGEKVTVRNPRWVRGHGQR